MNAFNNLKNLFPAKRNRPMMLGTMVLAFGTGALAQTSYNANSVPISGTDNAAFGSNCLTAITTGAYNFGFGRWSLVNTTSGTENCAFGGSVLGYNTTGSRNTGFGYASLGNNTTATDNTALGERAAMNTTTGSENVAIGEKALYTNQTKSGQVAIGYQALYSSNTANGGGWPNHAIGYKAMYATTTGLQNTAFGYLSLTANTTAHSSSAFGLYSLKNNTTGGENTGLGCVALSNNTTGGGNTAVGVLALDGNTTGSSNTSLGWGANVGSGGLTNAMALGQQAVVTTNNRTYIGNSTMTGVECATGVFTTSDGRFKKNVKSEDVKGLEFIQLLRPVVYNFDTREFTQFLVKGLDAEAQKRYMTQDFETATAVRASGFIAQEVEAAAKKVGYDFSGVTVPKNENENYSLSYDKFVVPLVKAVQEQQAMIDEQRKEIEALKKQVGQSTGLNGTAAGLEGFAMDQNQPNPFTLETVVNYQLPKEIKSAYMGIYDLSGKQLSSLPLEVNGSSITLSAQNLSAGIYIYTIVADGKALDSKRMIIAGK